MASISSTAHIGSSAHRASRMAARLAEDLHQLVGGAIDDCRLLDETWSAADHAEQLDHPRQPVHPAGRRGGGGHQVDGDLAGETAGGLEIDVIADPPGHHPTVNPGEEAGEEEEVTSLPGGDVASQCPRGLGEADAQLGEPLAPAPLSPILNSQ